MANRSLFNLALIGVFAALITAFSLAPAIPLPGPGVPITLQTLAIALTAMIIGPWRGAAAVVLYLVLGFAGLPVFAQGASGLGVLARPSGGYLVSFPIYAVVVGLLVHLLARRVARGRFWLFAAAGLVGSILVVHPLGIIGMARAIPLPLGTAIKADMVFWPGDLIKTMLAAAIAVLVLKAFPALLSRPERKPEVAAEAA